MFRTEPIDHVFVDDHLSVAYNKFKIAKENSTLDMYSHITLTLAYKIRTTWY